jgi:hypothetical protein
VTKQRSQPVVISVLVFLVGLGSAVYILVGIVSAFAPQLYRDNSGITSGNQIPSELELVGAIACLFYGLVGIWSLQELRQKSQTALLLVQSLATLKIIFGFFRFPLGLIFVLANILALVLARSNSAKSWVAKS